MRVAKINPGRLKLKRAKLTDKIFNKCVHLLESIAKKFRISYKTINVWFFCIIWPTITAGLFVALIIK